MRARHGHGTSLAVPAVSSRSGSPASANRPERANFRAPYGPNSTVTSEPRTSVNRRERAGGSSDSSAIDPHHRAASSLVHDPEHRQAASASSRLAASAKRAAGSFSRQRSTTA